MFGSYGGILRERSPHTHSCTHTHTHIHTHTYTHIRSARQQNGEYMSQTERFHGDAGCRLGLISAAELQRAL